MAKIDPTRSWACFEERLASEQNPIAKTLITEVRNHMKAEILGHMEPLMDTLTKEPIYHFWGHLPEMILKGREAVYGFYSDMMTRGGQQFEVVTKNIIADEHSVATEGQVKQLYLGEEVAGFGVTEVGGVALDPKGLYLGTSQLITVWPNAGDNKLLGEDIYFGQSPVQNLELVTRDDIAADFDWNPRYLANL